jgi:hypothetical protein
MIRQLAALVVLSLLTTVPALAQNASASKPEEPRPPATTNVQVELKISDHIGKAPPIDKTVSMIVADGRFGRSRSMNNPAAATLNVDATPRLQNGRIEVQLTLEYRPAPDMEAKIVYMPVSQALTVLLSNGKPLVIAKSADPSMDRFVTVEVTATILK